MPGQAEGVMTRMSNRALEFSPKPHPVLPCLSVLDLVFVLVMGADGATQRQTDRQTDRQTERQRDKQTDKQTDRQTGRQTSLAKLWRCGLEMGCGGNSPKL